MTATDTAVNTQSQPQTIGSMIDELHQINEEKKLLDRQILKLKESAKVIEARLASAMEAEGVTLSEGVYARMTITPMVVPRVDDWDLLYTHIKDNDAFYLLHRRVAATAFKELFEAGETIPGVSENSFDTMTLSPKK